MRKPPIAVATPRSLSRRRLLSALSAAPLAITTWGALAAQRAGAARALAEPPAAHHRALRARQRCRHSVYRSSGSW